MFIIGDKKIITKSKRKLATEFKMMHYFLDLEVWKKKNGIFLCPRKYVVKILKRFKMMDCKSHAYTNDNKFEVIE
jgi:hypothetical protein